MSGHPNRVSRFWHELKRRRVLHVITVYASASFAIIEIIGNLKEPLNLPTNLSTIVIIVLAVGFPLAVILSWLYDLTSGTFERTKPLDETEEDVKTVTVPNAWKIATYISFVVIVGLVAFNILTRGNVIKPGSIQSLVVLPFNNYTGQDNLDWFVSGMHSSLIQDMGTVGGLRIIGETSSNAFKGKNLQVTEIASELNVDAVIEADVLCLGEDTVCFQTRLIKSGQKEEQLWVADYKVARNQILNWYKAVTKQVAKEIKIKLTPEQELLLSKSRTVDREVYDEYWRALSDEGVASVESLLRGREFLNSAIKKDPNWAPLYSALAQVWIWIQQVQYEPPSVTAPEIYKNLNKAIELDPNLPEAHFLKALIAQLTEWDWEKSEREFLMALAINPNDARSRMFYGQLLLILQRVDEGVAQGRIAFSLDPLSTDMKLLYAGLLNLAGDYKTALPLAEEIVAADTGHQSANGMLAMAAFGLKEYDKAFEAYRYFLRYYNIDVNEIKRICSEQGFVKANEEIMNHLEEFAQNNPVSYSDMTGIYLNMNQPDKAMDWLEKGFELHDPIMTYITARGNGTKALFNNPRFIALVKKMNLPLPKTD
jgi:TolB-like protein/tetratricopeptide (TPR) repeat protein